MAFTSSFTAEQVTFLKQAVVRGYNGTKGGQHSFLVGSEVLSTERFAEYLRGLGGSGLKAMPQKAVVAKLRELSRKAGHRARQHNGTPSASVRRLAQKELARRMRTLSLEEITRLAHGGK